MGCNELLTAIDAYIKKSDDDFEKYLRDAGFLMAAELMLYMRDLEEQFADILSKQADIFRQALSEATDPLMFRIETLPRMAGLDTAAQGSLIPTLSLPIIDDTAERIAQAEKKMLDSALPKIVDEHLKKLNPELLTGEISLETLRWAERWSPKLGELMKLDSYDKMQDLLDKATTGGKSIDWLAQQFEESGIRDSYYRAQRAALTEMMRAHNIGAFEALMQDPSHDAKRWRHTSGYRTTPRENHIAINNQVVPKAERFELPGKKGTMHYPLYPVDPTLPPEESIYCHCLMEPAVIDENTLTGTNLRARQRAALDYRNKYHETDPAFEVPKEPEPSPKHKLYAAYTNKETADAELRPQTEELWSKLTAAEKAAAFRYTQGSGAFNRPLRGFLDNWNTFVGVGKVPFDHEGIGDMIADLTRAIEKSSGLPRDTVLFRGSDEKGLAGLLGIEASKITLENVEQLNKLFAGKKVSDSAFFSTATSKDVAIAFSEASAGDTGLRILYDVLAPKSSKTIYMEPFSAYGETNKDGTWNGVASSPMFGQVEVLLQRGRSFKVKGISLQNEFIYVILELLEEVD
ncbi:MAG: hypothetical protein LBT21_06335 [Oscillospiraceae bacterium]|jgi:hypothetical protein|nr:hypothetical protein [Oscillospiraceae bacterium]